MMKTDDLIAVLAKDTTQTRFVSAAVVLAVLVPICLAGTLLLLRIGVRHDLGRAVMAPLVVWKWLLPFLLASAGLTLALALSRPESRPRAALWGMAAVALVAAALFGLRAVVVPQADWAMAIKGYTVRACLTAITSMGLCGLICGLAVLRRGATTRPRLSGLAIGLASGGAAALVYALHCNQDDPMFYVVWYGAAILALGLIGAAAGRRVLAM